MQAIVYTSSTGHTAAYASMLGEKTGLPVYALDAANKTLARGTQIIYLGWLFANSVKGYRQAAKKFGISAVCAVGLCDTGTAVAEVRKANAIPEDLPLFTMQGGMDKTRLRGVNKLMIRMLISGLSAQKERSEKDERMLALLTQDRDYVAEENAAAFLAWYRGQGD